MEILDLDENKHYEFPSNRWFAIGKDDGQISRTIFEKVGYRLMVDNSGGLFVRLFLVCIEQGENIRDKCLNRMSPSVSALKNVLTHDGHKNVDHKEESNIASMSKNSFVLAL